jgi:hypothetical protein
MIIATGAALRFGAYSLADRGWDTLRSQREIRPSPASASPAPPPAPLSGALDVIPEAMKPATTPESYWTEHARRELENMERVAAENRSRFLDPHGLRTKTDFWDKDE